MVGEVQYTIHSSMLFYSDHQSYRSHTFPLKYFQLLWGLAKVESFYLQRAKGSKNISLTLQLATCDKQCLAKDKMMCLSVVFSHFTTFIPGLSVVFSLSSSAQMIQLAAHCYPGFKVGLFSIPHPLFDYAVFYYHRLTAFVLKSYVQAEQFIFIDIEEIKQSIKFLSSLQKPDGCFREVGMVHDKAMKVCISRN